MARLKSETAATGGAAPSGRAGSKLVFVGFMGSGKSRAARHAARALGAEALDSDSLLEAELGESISRFFDREGEAAFRQREESLVMELLDRPDAKVVSLGGGAVLSELVRERLAQHLCIHMEVEPEAAWERSRESERPLARERESFLALLTERTPLYESVARAIVPARDDLIHSALPAALQLDSAEVPSSTHMVWACTKLGGYPVYVGNGAIDSAGSLWPDTVPCSVVADEHVQALHGERLAAGLEGKVSLRDTITVPPGESHKTLTEAERVLRALAESRLERDDTLLAFGGGVVGDLAGFCAAVYQRGVSLVQVPTTLVAQVDSAYGGKTAVDLPDAKNYVGAFHHPKAVLTDPALLETLPVEELRAGFSEVIKTGLIAGGVLWQQVGELEAIERAPADDPGALRLVIEGCLRTKLAVVARDEQDHGARASLNLGHTFAHALEAAGAYRGYRHGEAVGLGLLVALRISERERGLDPAVRDQVGELLRRHGLPTTFSGPSTDRILAHAALDKKRRGGRNNLVLLESPGHVVWGCEVSDQALRDAIEEVGAGEESP